MPYRFVRSGNGGVDIIKRDTGKKVAHATSMKNAQIYAAKAEGKLKDKKK